MRGKRKPAAKKVEAWAVVWPDGAVEKFYTTKAAAQILGIDHCPVRGLRLIRLVEVSPRKRGGK